MRNNMPFELLLTKSTLILLFKAAGKNTAEYKIFIITKCIQFITIFTTQ